MSATNQPVRFGARVASSRNAAFLLAMVCGSTWAQSGDTGGVLEMSGMFAPEAQDIRIALNACPPSTLLSTCASTLGSTAFSGHIAAAAIDLSGVIEQSPPGVLRYLQFELKSKIQMYSGDYLQFIADASGISNGITVVLHQLNFVSAGDSLSGQTTLGASGVSDLSPNEPMLDAVNIPLTGILNVVWDQTADNPAAPNAMVLSATADGSELIVRGLLGVNYLESATSSSYGATVTVGLVAKDN